MEAISILISKSTLFSDANLISNVEFRVGFSLPNVSKSADLSSYCGQIAGVNDGSNPLTKVEYDYSSNLLKATVTCKDPNLLGRYITIQRFGGGQLGFSAVDYMPVAGKLAHYCVLID